MEPDLTHSLCEVGLVPWACLMVMNYCQATLLRDGLLREEIALLSIDPCLVVGNMDLTAKHFDQVLVHVIKRRLACFRICNEIFVSRFSILVRIFQNYKTESFHAIEITC